MSAAEVLRRARVVLIDVDGVLTAGGRAIPGAADFLTAVGDRAVIVSNNSTDTPATMAGHFARQGLAVDPNRIMLAGVIMIDTLAAEQAGQEVMLVAAEGMTTYAREAGLRLAGERAPTVALARDTSLSYQRLHHAARALHAGARLVVANPDLTHPDHDGGPVPETGALLAALMACVPAARPTVIGKPGARLFEAALDRAGVAARDAVMIGDNPDTDGAGARALGIATILVGPRGEFASVQDRFVGPMMALAPSAHFRIVHGPSLEDDGTVILVMLGNEGGAGRSPLGGTAMQVLRRILPLIGIAALPDLDESTPGDRALVMVSEAVAALLSNRAPAGVRTSKVHGPAGHIVPDMPRALLGLSLRMGERVIGAARSGSVDRDAIDDLKLQVEKASAQAGTSTVPWRDEVSFVIADQAKAQDVPVRWSSMMPQTLVLGEGRRHVRMIGSYPLSVSPGFGRFVTEDKTWSKVLLERMGLPTVPHRIVPDADAAIRAAGELGYPVIVKPVDGTFSRGVTIDIRDETDIPPAFAAAAAAGSAVIVQPYLDIADYRTFVLDGRMRIVYRRSPPYVVGDGRSTIRQLIDEHNAAVAAGRARFHAIRPVSIDPHLLRTLAQAGHSLDHVPAAEATVVLRGIPSRIHGGYVTNLTDKVHPENVRMFERALRVSGLLLTGMDFRAESVEVPWHAQRFAILELNLRPGIMDLEGERLASEIVATLFPSGESARMPTIVAIEDAPGSSAALRTGLAERRFVAGLSGPEGVHLDGFQASRSTVPIAEAHALMVEDSTADVAIHLASAARVALEGLGLDRIDAAFLPANPSGAAAIAVCALVRRTARRIIALPDLPAERAQAMLDAADATIQARPPRRSFCGA